MKRLLIVLLLSLFSGFTQAHEYFFAFAEMEYNQNARSFELSLIVSTHDIEHYLQDNGIDIGELEDHTEDKEIQALIGSALLKGFALNESTKLIEFNLVGYEVNLNGLTTFYFSSKNCKATKELEVRFDLLMNEYPKQQNKLTYLNKGKTQTVAFFPNLRSQIVKLEN